MKYKHLATSIAIVAIGSIYAAYNPNNTDTTGGDICEIIGQNATTKVGTPVGLQKMSVASKGAPKDGVEWRIDALAGRQHMISGATTIEWQKSPNFDVPVNTSKAVLLQYYGGIKYVATDQKTGTEITDTYSKSENTVNINVIK